MFGVYSPSIHTNFLPLFISISLTLKENGYSIYFIAPNALQKHQLKTYSLPSCREDVETLKSLGIKKVLIWNGVFHKFTLPEIQNYYFENAYFGDDLQIFKDGVNAVSELSSISYEAFLKYSPLESPLNFKIGRLVTKLDYSLYSYWVLGFFSQNPIQSIKYFYAIIKNILEKQKRTHILKNISPHKLDTDKYIIIGFQVHDDTQILYNSPLIKKMDDILDLFYKDIKTILPGHTVIVKEHPMDIGRVDYADLRHKYPEITWIQKGDIWDYIDESEYLICVNSSIGLQALSAYKKVISLGENFYSNNPWVKNIVNKEDFLPELQKLKEVNMQDHKKEIDAYIKVFREKIFISNGGWKSFDEKTIISICERLL